MSATVQYVVAGIFAGFALVAAFELIALSRRVAALESAASGNAEESEPRDEYGDEGLEAFDPREDETHSPAPSWSLGEDRWRPAAASSVRDDVQDPLKTVSFDAAMAAYNDLVADFGQAELQAFEQRWHPESAARTRENGLAEDRQGDFWIIRTGDAAKPYGLVVPGPEVMRNWELYYRSMGSMAAKNLLEGFYELGDGVPLRLKRPAIATQTERGWRVESPGRFAEG